MIYEGHIDQHFGSTTYSQNGEDLMLCNIFKLLGVDRPSYLDLGAHHPTNISNTKLLYERGSSGVNIEANPFLIKAFIEERKRDTNVCIGVGAYVGMTTFYMYDDTSGRNTFSLEEVESLKGIMEVREKRQIMVLPLNHIVAEYCNGIYPNLLSVDLEGLDYDVLEAADFSKSKPDVIIVETRENSRGNIENLLRYKWNYLPLCRMGENVIYILDRLHNYVC